MTGMRLCRPDASQPESKGEDMAFAPQTIRKTSRKSVPVHGLKGFGARLRVEGRFFSRAAQPLRIQGVTYGPFAPDRDGLPFPGRDWVIKDLAAMRSAGINALRTYHVPPEWLLELADEQELALLIDIPWPRHVCFLDSDQAQRQARQMVRAAAELGRAH